MYPGIEISIHLSLLLQFHFNVMPQYRLPVQSSERLYAFLRELARWSASSLWTYLTPKPSTKRENAMGRVICLHKPGVWATSKYPYGARCSFRAVFASLPACGKLYMDLLIST